MQHPRDLRKQPWSVRFLNSGWGMLFGAAVGIIVVGLVWFGVIRFIRWAWGN